MVKRITILLLFVAIIGASALVLGEEGTVQERPNVVIFFADDMGYGDLACYGNELVNTPNLDAMAKNGIRFTQMLTASPICTPSRTGLLTGRYPVRSGMESSKSNSRTLTSPAHPGGLPLDQVTIAKKLKSLGYDTGIFGKWHLGIGEGGKFLPTNHGFDTYYGMAVTNVETCREGETIYQDPTSFHFFFGKTSVVLLPIAALLMTLALFRWISFKWALVFIVAIGAIAYWYMFTFTLLNPKSCLLYRNTTIVEQPVRLDGLTQRLTREAVDFIKSREKGKSFFAYIPFVHVHTALFSAPEFKGVSKAGPYGDNVEELDWSVGEIVGTLRELGLLENTIIFFSSDNGPYLERYDQGGSSGHVFSSSGEKVRLKGGKAQNWEGGLRVPGIVQWEGKIAPNQVYHSPVSLMDIFPTILDIIGEDPTYSEKEFEFDGRSLLPLFRDISTPSPHEYVFHYCGQQISSIRRYPYKIHYNTPVWEEGVEACPLGVVCGCEGSAITVHSPPLLYNLDSDPGENHPLGPDDVPEYDELLAAFDKAKKEHMATVKPVVNQFEQLPLPWLMPCCNFPYCFCVENTTMYAAY